MTATATISEAKFYEMGKGCLHRAHMMSRPGKEAKTVLLYSIITMAIENLCMSILVNRNIYPMDHSMLDLIYALEECGLMDKDIKEGMMRIEMMFNLAELGPASSKEPSMKEVEGFLATADMVYNLAEMEMKASA